MNNIKIYDLLEKVYKELQDLKKEVKLNSNYIMRLKVVINMDYSSKKYFPANDTKQKD